MPRSILLVRLSAIRDQLQSEASATQPNASAIARAAELFVDALSSHSPWYEELVRRAKLIEDSCGPSTRYDEWKRNAHTLWHSWQGAQNSSTANLIAPAWSSVERNPDGELNLTPSWLSDIQRERESLERVLDCYGSNIPRKLATALQAWLRSCRRIERLAAGFQVDGARWLWRVHACGQSNPTDTAGDLRDVVRRALAPYSYDQIADAASSMMAWAEQHPETMPDTAAIGESSGLDQGTKNAHSDDFRSVTWNGETYSFSASQAAVVKVLWEHYYRGTPEISSASLFELAGIASERPSVVFRSHPAFNNMIVRGSTKGTLRLSDIPAPVKKVGRPSRYRKSSA